MSTTTTHTTNNGEATESQNVQAVIDILAGMTLSVKGTRESIQNLMESRKTKVVDEKAGISLLAAKNHIMLSYIHSLTLLSAQRACGGSLADRKRPPETFGDKARSQRGNAPGDLVDSLVENRIVLEKIRVLESRLRYQIEKLVKLADQPETQSKMAMQDPLAFRPNPQNLLDAGLGREDRNENNDDDRDGIYRPPRVAPMPYVEQPVGGKKKKERVPMAVADHAHISTNAPHMESTSGLGGTGLRGAGLQSARAKELARMQEFEEENMTRLVMNKKEARRRKQDEATIALGGSANLLGNSRGRSRGGGLADEFGDILRANHSTRSTMGRSDGYEALRARGAKKSAFERSKSRPAQYNEVDGDEGRPKKRARLEQEIRKNKKRK